MANARVALVTGGARGIGKEIGLALANKGWDVAICYRTSAGEAAATKAALEKSGRRALSVRCDVSDPENVTQLVQQVNTELGTIDCLVHAAGPYHRAEILQETPEGWRKMMTNNLDSLFFCAKAVAPGM